MNETTALVLTQLVRALRPASAADRMVAPRGGLFHWIVAARAAEGCVKPRGGDTVH